MSNNIESSKYPWEIYNNISDEKILANEDYPIFLQQLLYNRKIRTESEMKSFLDPMESINEYSILPNIDKATNYIANVIRNDKKICVFGDFDVDGISATAILGRTFKAAGVTIIPHIPNRFTEGHGLNREAIKMLKDLSVELIITVDTGTTAIDEINYANELGVSVIVTDHHLTFDALPDAIAIINPQLPDSMYPFMGLTGAGLALKLAESIIEKLNLDKDILDDLYSLATLGTVADVGALISENRGIVNKGLKAMGQKPLMGIKALAHASGRKNTYLNVRDLSWNIIPRLNATGRMGDPKLSYDILTTNEFPDAVEKAKQIEEYNFLRREETQKGFKTAMSTLEPGSIYIAQDKTFHWGIIGLLANRIAGRFHKPAIVISEGEEYSLGSARSIENFDVGNIIEKTGGLIGGFEKFGGHAQAAGFTIENSKIPLFKKTIQELSRNYSIENNINDMNNSLKIDCKLELDNLPDGLLKIIGMLRPFGEKNPEPLFMSKNLTIQKKRLYGSRNRAALIQLKSKNFIWDTFASNNMMVPYEVGDKVDIVYSFSLRGNNMNVGMNLNIQDIRHSVIS
ncbi:MAG: single-stranded-DNA-specific exonuclease RecJ [Dehalococcoidia bacterium]